MPCDSLWVLIAHFCFCSQSLSGREASTFLCGHLEMHAYQEVCLNMITSWLSEALGSHVIILSLWEPEERGWLDSFFSLLGPQVSIKQTKPWGIKYRLPGSALTVTPWLVSPLNEGSKYLCYTHPYLLWLKTNWSSTIRAFLLLLKVGDLRELVCECLHCAKTYSKPIRIYICYKLFISSRFSKYYLPSRMGVIGLKNNQYVNCGSGMWTQTSLTLESLIFRRNTHKASISSK